jgi:hypothetical protein
LQAVRSLAGVEIIDALTDADTLGRAVGEGIMDAPHLRNNPFAPGKVETRIVNGASQAIGPDRKPLLEEERLAKFL